ncbi:MAG: amidohydrolase family protein [Myxococcota bacterium]
MSLMNVAVAAALVLAGAPAASDGYVLHAGRLIDGRSASAKSNMSIVVKDGKIASVRRGFIKPKPGQALIDLKDHTVMPGLMDMHTHITMQHNPRSYSERFFMEPADYALRSVGYAEKTLMAGFTTIRDLGDRYNISVSLRNAIRKGWIKGPRIFTSAKSLATTGGHADPTNGLRRTLKGDPGPAEGVINGPDDARKAVRQRYKDGADLIKLTATGGVLSLAKSGQNPQFTMEELVAVVDTAKDYGFTVAVHAHGAEGMKRALRAGVTSIEHGTYMDAEVMKLMREKGAYYVPTISAGKWVAMKAKQPGYFPEVVRPKAATIGIKIAATFARAHRNRVNIAFGTDSGVSPHGDNANEFVYMVEGGMSAMLAIKSATLNAARLLRIDDRLGTIERGKLADIVAVAGNPLKDIKRMLNMAFVMKDGKVFKAP